MWTPDEFVAAWHFAATAHGDQRVPGNNFPYLAHLGLVFSEVAYALRAEPGFDESLALHCAILHDTLEDTDVEPVALEAQFGPKVLAGVQALSKDDRLPKADRIADSLRRIQAQPREVWLVKLADRTANMLPAPPHWSTEKRHAYRDEARQILDALGAASPTLSRRLASRIASYLPAADA